MSKKIMACVAIAFVFLSMQGLTPIQGQLHRGYGASLLTLLLSALVCSRLWPKEVKLSLGSWVLLSVPCITVVLELLTSLLSTTLHMTFTVELMDTDANNDVSTAVRSYTLLHFLSMFKLAAMPCAVGLMIWLAYAPSTSAAQSRTTTAAATKDYGWIERVCRALRSTPVACLMPRAANVAYVNLCCGLFGVLLVSALAGAPRYESGRTAGNILLPLVQWERSSGALSLSQAVRPTDIVTAVSLRPGGPLRYSGLTSVHSHVVDNLGQLSPVRPSFLSMYQAQPDLLDPVVRERLASAGPLDPTSLVRQAAHLSWAGCAMMLVLIMVQAVLWAARLLSLMLSVQHILRACHEAHPATSQQRVSPRVLVTLLRMCAVIIGVAFCLTRIVASTVLRAVMVSPESNTVTSALFGLSDFLVSSQVLVPFSRASAYFFGKDSGFLGVIFGDLTESLSSGPMNTDNSVMAVLIPTFLLGAVVEIAIWVNSRYGLVRGMPAEVVTDRQRYSPNASPRPLLSPSPPYRMRHRSQSSEDAAGEADGERSDGDHSDDRLVTQDYPAFTAEDGMSAQDLKQFRVSAGMVVAVVFMVMFPLFSRHMHYASERIVGLVYTRGFMPPTQVVRELLAQGDEISFVHHSTESAMDVPSVLFGGAPKHMPEDLLPERIGMDIMWSDWWSVPVITHSIEEMMHAAGGSAGLPWWHPLQLAVVMRWPRIVMDWVRDVSPLLACILHCTLSLGCIVLMVRLLHSTTRWCVIAVTPTKTSRSTSAIPKGSRSTL